MKHLFRHSISWLLSISLVLSANIPAAQATNRCVNFMKKIEAQRIKAEELAQADLADRGLVLFKTLAPEFLLNNRDTLIQYLYLKSPRSDALAALVSISQTLKNKKDAYEESTIKQSSAKLNLNAIDFPIRMHPALHEILKAFEVPGVIEDFNQKDADLRQVIEELKDQRPFVQQIMIRLALQQIAESKPINISSYAYAILFEAATQLAQGPDVDTESKKLAANLGMLLDMDSLYFDNDLAKKQILTAAQSTLQDNNINKARIQFAIKSMFVNAIGEPSHAMTLSFIGGLATAGTYLWQWINSDDWSASSHYSLPNEMLIVLLGVLGIKFTLNFLRLVKSGEPHPGGYLKEETEARFKLLLNETKKEVDVILGVLQHNSTNVQPSTIAAHSIAVASKDNLVSVQKNSNADNDMVIPSSIVKKENPAEVPSAPKIVNVNDISAKVIQAQAQMKATGFEPAVKDEDRKSGERFRLYWDGVRKVVAERDVFFEHMQIGLLMIKPANIQIVGEPGVAKSVGSIVAMNGIVDEQGKTSFFQMQLGANTTIDDLLGTVKPSELRNDRIVRASENALPGKQLALLDEYYRAPGHTRQDLLTLQATGTVNSTGETYVSKNRLTVYASNTYPNQVFSAAKDDSPLAEMDRMLFTHVVPPILENDDSMIELKEIRGEKLPELTFADIDNLKVIAKDIPLNRYYRSKLKLLVNIYRERVLKEEHASLVEWHAKVTRGDLVLTSPERNHRVLSPRSELTAQVLLTRFAMFDWIRSGMKPGTKPEVTEEHFDRLREFFLSNSSSDAHLKRVLRQYAEGSIPYHEYQMILKFRDKYKETIEAMENEIHQSPIILNLRKMVKQMNISWDELNSGKPLLNNTLEITIENAGTIDEFLAWYADIEVQLRNRGKIVEITANDVALDKAQYLAQRILTLFKERK